ncbi:MAG: hypothetical protein ACXAEX_01485 [Promethearchaeota archaeon]|jgi:hypothetical protein
MSSQTLEKENIVVFIYERPKEEFINFDTIIIPFSRFFKNHINDYVYSGKEKIPFKKRDPSYQAILRREFSQ